MRELRIGTTRIADDEKPYIIAEIGSNHNGDFDTCLKMIRVAAQCGVSAVKLQKRFNDVLFTKAKLAEPYDNDNSFGKTYGEHRAALDWFGRDEFEAARDEAWKRDVDFIVTPFDFKAVDFLKDLDIDAFKIASCDLPNINLIRSTARLGKPVIVSCGGHWGSANAGSRFKTMLIRRAYNELSLMGAKFALLHCVSEYKSIADSDLNLKTIPWMLDNFDVPIGFSSHHPSIEPLKRAYELGASIIEAHFTLSRANKGTDHAFSLEPRGLAQLCEDINRIPVFDGEYGPGGVQKEDVGFIHKMGKAVHVVKPIRAGEKLTVNNVALKAPAQGIPPYEFDNVLGKIAICDLSTSGTLDWGNIK